MVQFQWETTCLTSCGVWKRHIMQGSASCGKDAPCMRNEPCMGIFQGLNASANLGFRKHHNQIRMLGLMNLKEF